MPTLVLFDFDKTIINKDTGYCFIIFALRRNVIRTLFAIILLPIAWIPYLTHRTRYIGNSLFLWLATVGLDETKLASIKAEFITQFTRDPSFKVYKDAIKTIRSHLDKHHKVIIVSGSSEWMVMQTLKALDLPQLEIVASTEATFCAGQISKFHCYASNKVGAIHQAVDLDSFTTIYGYSDSVTDIPMLLLCDHRHVVNPEKSSKKHFKTAFGADFTALEWL